MTDQLYDVISLRDQNGSPYFANCTLVLGDNSDQVVFKDGLAQVPARLAGQLANSKQVRIPALAGGNFAVEAAPQGVIAPQQTNDSTAADGVVAAQAARIRELEAMLANGAAQQPAALAVPAEAPAAPDADPAVAEAKRQEAIRLAKEYLQEEGETIPEPEPAAPREGWEAKTADDQARCQAEKANGEQCANPVKDGAACHLAQHQEQLAAAPAASE